MVDNWRNIEYLLKGTEKMKAVYYLMKSHGILQALREFDPVIIGTIPINVDIENSDIDIACHVRDFKYFADTAAELFFRYDDFSINYGKMDKAKYVTVSFMADDFEIEIFGQDQPVVCQNGYRHMVIEERILELGGEALRSRIIALKKAGVKTEPAFAKVLNLSGDPYLKLLELEGLDDEHLMALVKSIHNTNENQ